MKYTKRLLISMSFFAFLLTVSGCTSEDVIGGGSKEHPAIQTIRATKSDFITTQEVDVPLTRTTIDGYKTTFNDGDKIGLFAIKDGAIVDNVNNMALTCSVATDGSNTTSWTLPANTKIYYYEGVTYIAYYPYNENVTIDASKTKEEIIKSLVDNSYLQPKDNQSATDGSDHAASDLMIATANANASDILKVSLSLKFEHQFSLLIMTPQILCTNITAPESAGFTYRGSKSYVIDPVSNSVTLSGISPLQMSDGSYRAIMKPDMLKSVSVRYKTNNNKYVSYNCKSDEISITSGQYYTLVVNSPGEYTGSVARPLKPGDFVFHGTSGIEIYPGDGDLNNKGMIPDTTNIVGIVVTCDPKRMTDSICNANNWNHAYVIGFAVNSSTTPHTWGTPSVDLDFLTNYTTNNGASNMNGCTETEKMFNYIKTATEDSSIPEKDRPTASSHTFSLNELRAAFPVPEDLIGIRSNWFIPSVGQYYDLLINLCGGKIDTDFSITDNSWKAIKASDMYNSLKSYYDKAGKFAPNNTEGHWTSSEYDQSNAWYITLTSSTVELTTYNKSSNSSPNRYKYIYGFFAF